MNTQPFSLVNNRKEQLQGLMSKPEGNSLGSILLIHGLALNLHEPGFDQLTEMLVEKGLTVFRINMSDKDITLTNWSDDIRTLYSFVKDQGISNISVVAHSLGASATIAAQLPFEKMVLLAPTVNFYETMQLVFKDGFNPNGESIRKWSETQITTLGPEFLRDTKHFDFLQIMKESQSKLFYIHGSSDNKVLVNSSLPLYEASTQPKEQLIGDFEHMLNPDREMIFQTITKWLIASMQK